MESNVKKLAVIALVAVSFAACSKPDAGALLAKGNDYFDKKMVAEAIVQYKMAIQADPKRGDVRSKLSDAYLLQRDGRGALREAVNAADLLPNDAAAQVKAGNYLLMARAFEDAQSRADKALAIDPKSADALVLKGNAMAGLKDLDNALGEYQEALALNPTGDQIYANIGAIQASKGQTAEAEATFRKAVEVAPKSVNARMALASFLWASKRAPEAEVALKEALALEPANLVANRALGTFYMASGRGAEAEPYFKAIAAAANTDEAQLALADYYLAIKRVGDAKAILTPLSQKKESSGPASLRLAAIEVGNNNRPVASTIVRGILDKEPKYAPARVFELRLFLMDNKLDDAMTAATALIKDEPNSTSAAEASFIIGGIEASRDRLDEAGKAYEDALRIAPQSLPVVMSLAQLQLRMGNGDKAEAYARQVLAAQPGNPAARAIIVRSYLMRGDVTKGAAELASLQKEYPNALPVQNLVAAQNLAAGRYDAARAAYAKVAAAAPNDLEALQGLVIIDLQAGPEEGRRRSGGGGAQAPAAQRGLVRAGRASACLRRRPAADRGVAEAGDREGAGAPGRLQPARPVVRESEAAAGREGPIPGARQAQPAVGGGQYHAGHADRGAGGQDGGRSAVSEDPGRRSRRRRRRQQPGVDLRRVQPEPGPGPAARADRPEELAGRAARQRHPRVDLLPQGHVCPGRACAGG